VPQNVRTGRPRATIAGSRPRRSIVATSAHSYVQYNGSTANFGRYDVFDRIGTGAP